MRDRARHIVTVLIAGVSTGLLASPLVSSTLAISLGNPSGVLVDLASEDDPAAVAGGWIGGVADAVRDEPALVLACVASSVLLFGLVMLGRAAFDPEREIVNGVFGSQTSVRSHREIVRRCRTWAGEVSGDCGVVVGYCRGRCVLSDAVHTVVCAPSGSYKTRASVLPSVACVSLARRASLIVTDPSLELWCYSRPMLEERGYDAMLIDLENPYRGSRVNFLLPLVKLHEQGLDYLVEERAMEIGAMLFPETGSERDDFAQPAAGLVAAVSDLVTISDDVPRAQTHL